MSRIFRSIELGESFADRAPVRSGRGASSVVVKSRVKRLGREGLEGDCDEVADWLSDDHR
jgi:hypothetical protein